MRRRSGTNGFSLVELIIGIMLLLIVLSATGWLFRAIIIGHTNLRQKQAALHLAEEKIDDCRKRPYFRLIPNSMLPETRTIGSIVYTVNPEVDKIDKNPSTGVLEVTNIDADTGLKRITVDVTWSTADGNRKITQSTLVTNPRHVLPAKLHAEVKAVVGGATITGATVRILENPSWHGLTQGDGTCLINLASGTWTVEATHPLYMPQLLTQTVPINNVSSVTFHLDTNPIAVAPPAGNVTGAVGTGVSTNHLVISEAGIDCVSTCFEFVEVYNPTPSPITLWNGTAEQVRLFTQARMGVNASTTVATSSMQWPIGTSVSVASHGFFLFSNDLEGGYSDHQITGTMFQAVYPNGVALYDVTNPAFLVPIDQVTMRSAGTSCPDSGASGQFVEGAPFENAPGTGCGFDGTVSASVERKATASATSGDMDYVAMGQYSSSGNAYDSDNNASDFVSQQGNSSISPQLAASGLENPPTGTLPGTVVWAHVRGDPTTIAPSYNEADGSGNFSLSLPTGSSWTIRGSSRAVNNMICIATDTTHVWPPKSSVSPALMASTPLANVPPDQLFSYVTGIVSDGSSSLGNIKILCGSMVQFTSDENADRGRFFLPLLAPLSGMATAEIIINPDSFTAAFSTATITLSDSSTYPRSALTSSDISGIRDLGTIELAEQVRVSGYVCVTPNTGGQVGCLVPEMGMGVVAYYNGAALASSLSDPDGHFDLELVSKKDYYIRLVLEPGESATPDEFHLNVSDFHDVDSGPGKFWVADRNSGTPITFDMSQGYSPIHGVVRYVVAGSTKPFNETALIVASKVSLAGAPPDMGSGSTATTYAAMSRKDGTFDLYVPIPGNYYFYAWKGTDRKAYNGGGVVATTSATTLEFQWP